MDIVFDNETTFQAAYGTARGDTISVCGDANNGFGFLINWNNLRDGPHDVRVLADGVEFGHVTIKVNTLGTDFLRGASGSAIAPHFPQQNVDTVLEWQESLQGFTITGTVPTASSNYNGSWTGRALSSIDVALSDVTCTGADLSVRITSPTFSGSLVTEGGISLAFSGVASTEGVLGGAVRRDGSYFAVFTGSVNGGRIAGRWNDIFGCWGDFELERD